MRRSTAAAVGTLAGAAMIIGVRLSVTGPVPAPVAVDSPADPVDAVDADNAEPSQSPSANSRGNGGGAVPSATPSRKGRSSSPSPTANGSGLQDGTFKGTAVSNPYGTVQVSITISGGKITNAQATYPTTGQSGSINENAIPKLKQQALQAQSAKIDTVSGATFTSEGYAKSLQAALDAAKG